MRTQTLPGLGPCPRYVPVDADFPASGDVPVDADESDFLAATRRVAGPLTIDPRAVASMVSFSCMADSLTLVEQVRRRGWLETVTGGDDPPAGPDGLPAHHAAIIGRRQAARLLVRALECDTAEALRGAGRVVLALSGGLDSRLIAAIVVRLARRGAITGEICSFSWGIHGCRDVEYGRQVAARLGIDWTHLPLTAEDLSANLRLAGSRCGALISPVNLHALRRLPELGMDSGDVVVTGAFGNEIGRARYFGRHLLRFRPLVPTDRFALMRPDAFDAARPALEAAMAATRRRPGRVGLLGGYEREGLAHDVAGLALIAFGLIADPHSAYHGFAGWQTVSLMWGLHPALRGQAIYHLGLAELDRGLAMIPYARTNREPRPGGHLGDPGLAAASHRYPRWLAHELDDEVSELLDPSWFDATGLFDGVTVRRRWESFRRHPEQLPALGYLLAWLCSFRLLISEIDERRVSFGVGTGPAGPAGRPRRPPAIRHLGPTLRGRVGANARQFPGLIANLAWPARP